MLKYIRNKTLLSNLEIYVGFDAGGWDRAEPQY